MRPLPNPFDFGLPLPSSPVAQARSNAAVQDAGFETAARDMERELAAIVAGIDARRAVAIIERLAS